MSSGPKQHPIQSLVVHGARALLASIVTLSFFATMAPLGNAKAGVMACCVGKTGHESGSCSSGLLQAANKIQTKPKVFTGQESAPRGSHSSKTIEAKDGGHCSHHSPPAGETPSDSTKQSEPEPTSTKSDHPSSTRIHTLSSPCSAECAVCSMSFTRRPRPREQATLSFVARPRLHLTRNLPASEYPQIKPLDTRWVQLRPRGPPTRLS
jgi:hypothetical protein